MEFLSLISVGKEFQMCAPSNMKLFFSYLYAACHQAKSTFNESFFLHFLEVYNLIIVISLLKVNKSVSDLGPILFNNLNISLDLAFILSVFISKASKATRWSGA